MQAEAWCVSHGAQLATIDSAYQTEGLRKLLPRGSKPLIGLNDIVTEGTWGWVDGSMSSYRNWKPGEPNNYPVQGSPTGEDCTALHADDGRWNDVTCNGDRHSEGFICRMSNYNASSYAPAASELVTFCDRADGERLVTGDGAGHCCTLVQGRYGVSWMNNGNDILSVAPCPVMGSASSITHGISFIRANGKCRVHVFYGTSESKCADEGQTCTCPAGDPWGVIYGKGSTWTEAKSLGSSGSLACSNRVFGDPLRGTRKECRCIHNYGGKRLEGPGTWTGPGGSFTDNAVTGVKIVCGEGYMGDFVFHAGPKSWHDAEADCISRGSHLATLQSMADVRAAEQAAIYAGASTSQMEFWIGLHDRVRENAWEWTSRSEVNFTHWVLGSDVLI